MPARVRRDARAWFGAAGRRRSRPPCRARPSRRRSEVRFGRDSRRRRLGDARAHLAVGRQDVVRAAVLDRDASRHQSPSCDTAANAALHASSQPSVVEFGHATHCPASRCARRAAQCRPPAVRSLHARNGDVDPDAPVVGGRQAPDEAPGNGSNTPVSRDSGSGPQRPEDTARRRAAASCAAGRSPRADCRARCRRSRPCRTADRPCGLHWRHPGALPPRLPPRSLASPSC